MTAIYEHTDQRGSRRTRNTLALGRLVALMLAASLGAQVSAESPWTKLSRAISPKASTAKAAQANPAPFIPAAAAEVPDENPLAALSQANPAAKRPEIIAGAPAAPASKIAMPGKPAGGQKGANGAMDGDNKLGLETEENEALLATDLFKQPEIRQLLGDTPRFIYDPASRPDPMLVPWVRRAAIFKELSAAADACMAQGQVKQAVEYYEQILKLNDPRFSTLVQTKLAEIAGKQQSTQAKIMVAEQQKEEKIELPGWVADNTTGVILSPGAELCLVGEYMLHVGDTLPNYPDIKVTAIAGKQVTYQIRSKMFEVKLNLEQ